MRRLASLLAGGALFLLIGAIPALADGGPHSVTTNSGSPGINADSCAGCHRAHTAQGAMLLVSDESDLCLTCHGGSGNGATTDVMNGVQYKVGETQGTGAILGALRSGGFENARIDSGNAARLAYQSGSSVRQLGMVPVRSSGQDVTSTHMVLGTPRDVWVWGNGAISATPFVGGTTTMECTSCHNPHGNGQYRSLNPIPRGSGGTMTASATSAPVDDAPLPPPGDARNYTVIQKKGTEGTPSTYLLYASQVAGVYDPTVGDYFHRRVPWNASASGTSANDAPNGKPTTFDGQINNWCAQCHTRYLAITGTPYDTDSGDAIFKYRHSNTSNKPCTTCHVAHGSNAQMTGQYSSDFEYPNGGTSASSRLLKIDN